jgi:nucleoside-diphosphate-sugar epimerase
MGIYGPGDPGRFLMLYRAVQRGRFLMFGDGKTFYHPCYIDNLVDSFELAAEHPKAVGGTYLIGDDRYVSLNELVRGVGESLGKPRRSSTCRSRRCGPPPPSARRC